MKQVTEYAGKKVVTIGLAKSGMAAVRLLKQLGADVIATDQKRYEENSDAQQLKQEGIDVVCGEPTVELLTGVDLVVKNPGVPYRNVLVAEAERRGIPIITEVELAYKLSESPFIGITGSNGKTTTTTLVFEMMKAAERKPLIAGNIGTVACEVAQTAPADVETVIELSSFQLMGIETFKPKVAVLLNIFDAHLDYHRSKDEYVMAKLNIFRNQTSTDVTVANYDDAIVRQAAATSKAELVYFSVKEPFADGGSVIDGTLYYKGEPIIACADIVLPGQHNLENILAAICAVKVFGVSNEAIRQVLTTFSGVEHRLQYVTTVNGRKFYNDSKATNILATEKALTSFTTPTILLAGGLDRGNEFDELKRSLTAVKTMVVYGETKEKLARVATELNIPVVRCDTLAEAVQRAYEQSVAGDTILLSPACASWDQFKTFEQRGATFVSAVQQLS